MLPDSSTSIDLNHRLITFTRDFFTKLKRSNNPTITKKKKKKKKLKIGYKTLPITDQYTISHFSQSPL